MADGQTTMTPPPDPTEFNLKRTTGDKIGGFLGAISKGGALGTISEAFERAHQKRLAEAKMYHDVMVEKTNHLASLDKNDPDYQKNYQEANAALEAAEKEYYKRAPDPETKKQMQMRSQIAKHHLGLTPHMTGPPSPTPQGPQPSAGANAPPAATGSATAVPPPPAPDMGKVMAGVPGEMQRDADKRQLEIKKAEETAKTAEALKLNEATFDQRRKQADSIKLKPDTTEYQEFVATGKFPTTSKPTAMSRGVAGDELTKQGITMVDGSPLEPKKMYDVFQNSDGTQFAMPSGISSTSAAARLAGTTGSGLMAVVARANQGDKQAQKDLKSYMDMQVELAKARGIGYGSGRAMFQLGNYIDDDGSVTGTPGKSFPLSNYDAIQMIREGKNITASGKLPASMIASAQRLVMESAPAIKEVRTNLGAFDNAGDRAIFARLLSSSKPTAGNESGWLGNILNQALAENLSDEGRKLVVRISRLNETVGALRSTLGTPATDRSMALMQLLVPGPGTPDSRMAGDILDQLEQNITNAVQLPILKPVSKSAAPPVTPPPAPGEPTRPASVPPNYIFKADGPKGAGWYKPEAKAAGK